MELRIIGTEKTIDIEYLGPNGTDDFGDIASNVIEYNEDDGVYEISQEDADWWEIYISTEIWFYEKLEELCDYYGLDYKEELEKIAKEYINFEDMDSHVSSWNLAIEDLEETMN